MKRAKIIRLAAVAAMALMAFVGAGTASATTLCENNQTSNCTLHVNAGSVLDFSVEPKTTFLTQTTGGTKLDTCTGGTVKGVTTTGGDTTGETVSAAVAAATFTFTDCDNLKITITAGELEVHSITGSDYGTFTAKGFAITFQSAIGHCHYSAGAGIDLGTFTPDTVNGTAGTLDVNTVMTRDNTHTNDVFCPATIIWLGSYTQTSTTPIRAVAAS